MKLSWHGTASILLESEGYRIAFDPFLTIPLHETTCRRKLHAVKYRTADSVLVTHGHFDHLFYVPELLAEGDPTVFCRRTPMRPAVFLSE